MSLSPWREAGGKISENIADARRFLPAQQGGLMTAKRQQRAPSWEEVIIKRLQNTDGSFSIFLPLWLTLEESDNRALQLSWRRPHLAGRKPPALLQPEQPTGKMSPRRLSRVHITLSRGRPNRGRTKGLMLAPPAAYLRGTDSLGLDYPSAGHYNRLSV